MRKRFLDDSEDDIGARIERLEVLVTSLIDHLGGDRRAASRKLAEFIRAEARPEIFWERYLGARRGDESAAKNIEFSGKKGISKLLDIPINEAAQDVVERYLQRSVRVFEQYGEVLSSAERAERVLALMQAAEPVARQLLDFDEELIDQAGNAGQRFENLETRVSTLFERQDTLYANETSLETALLEVRRELHEFMYIESQFRDSTLVPYQRTIPVRVYCTNEDPKTVEGIIEAVGRFLEAEGLQVADSFASERGSWFKKWWVKTKDRLTQRDVKEKLSELGEKAQHAVELEKIYKAQACANKDNASALNDILKAIGDADGVISIGSLLVVKYTEASGRAIVAAQTLTATQMLFLEKNPHLLKAPSLILTELSGCERPTAMTSLSEADVSAPSQKNS